MLSRPNLDKDFFVHHGGQVLMADSAGWTSVYSADGQKAFERLCLAYARANLNIQEPHEGLAAEMCRTYVSSHEVFSQPPPHITECNVKEGTVHPNFRARSKAGEILVSDYERGSVIVSQAPGYIGGEEFVVIHDVAASHLVEQGFLTTRVVNGRENRLAIPGTNYVIPTGADSSVAFSYSRVTSYEGTWVYPTELHANDVMKAIRSQEKRETTALVTRVTAKANRSSVDVLTSMAELPESIKSVIAGFKAIATITRDYKARKFSITKSYGLRDKKRNEQFKNRMKRLNRELASSSLSPKRREALLAHKKRVEWTHRKALSGSAIELADALADIWLNYRYNIMPNVYLAQDVYDAIHKYGRQFVTARDFVVSNDSIPVNGIRLAAQLRTKCMIKRSFTSGSAKRGASVISNDLFVTAWELVPLSFVYGWLINIGDLLSATTYSKSGWDQEGNTLSYKTEIDVEVDLHPVDNYLIEPVTQVRARHYMREVFNPSACIGLVWQPNLGLERYLDALALIWRPVRSLLLKGKNS